MRSLNLFPWVTVESVPTFKGSNENFLVASAGIKVSSCWKTPFSFGVTSGGSVRFSLAASIVPGSAPIRPGGVFVLPSGNFVFVNPSIWVRRAAFVAARSNVSASKVTLYVRSICPY